MMATTCLRRRLRTFCRGLGPVALESRGVRVVGKLIKLAGTGGADFLSQIESREAGVDTGGGSAGAVGRNGYLDW